MTQGKKIINTKKYFNLSWFYAAYWVNASNERSSKFQYQGTLLRVEPYVRNSPRSTEKKWLMKPKQTPRFDLDFLLGLIFCSLTVFLNPLSFLLSVSTCFFIKLFFSSSVTLELWNEGKLLGILVKTEIEFKTRSIIFGLKKKLKRCSIKRHAFSQPSQKKNLSQHSSHDQTIQVESWKANQWSLGPFILKIKMLGFVKTKQNKTNKPTYFLFVKMITVNNFYLT